MPAFDVPDYRIKIDGMDLPLDASADLKAVRVEEDLDALSMFTIELGNWDDEHQRTSWSDSTLFALGGEVELRLGYLDDLHPVMTGQITDLEPQFASGRAPALIVRGYDLRHRMDRTLRTATYQQVKDSDLASRLAKLAGLRSEVADSRMTQEFLIQSNQSDLEFLRARAKLIGYEVYVREKTLHFHPPKHTTPPIMNLGVGVDLTDFTPRLSSRGQVGEVTARGWDLRKKEAVVSRSGDAGPAMGTGTPGGRRADRAFGRSTGAVVDVPITAPAQADQLAKAGSVRSGLGYVRGEAAGPGMAEIRAGTVVQIDGAGKAFSGPYYVTSVSHDLRMGTGFRSSMELLRNAS